MTKTVRTISANRKSKICLRAIATSLLPLVLLTLASLPLAEAKADKRLLSKAELNALVQNDTEMFPNDIRVEANDLVLKWLNRLLRTSHGRSSLRDSLNRMKPMETIILGKLNEMNLPKSLSVIPLQESGYRNLSTRTGGGIWQLVKGTARRYGLQVEKNAKSNIDERLDIEKATSVSLKHLADLHERFKDWPLALIAYNTGEGALSRAIRKAKSRAPFTVIKAGGLKPSQKVYLPKLMALILIARHPDLIEN